ELPAHEDGLRLDRGAEARKVRARARVPDDRGRPLPRRGGRRVETRLRSRQRPDRRRRDLHPRRVPPDDRADLLAAAGGHGRDRQRRAHVPARRLALPLLGGDVSELIPEAERERAHRAVELEERDPIFRRVAVIITLTTLLAAGTGYLERVAASH